MYIAGTTLRIDYGTYNHYGIADGIVSVIHNSKKYKKVVKETVEEFAENKEIFESNITSSNPEKAVITASRYLGMPYNLFISNCEHFARLAHGLEKESTQIQQYLLFALGAGIAIKSDNKNIKILAGSVACASLLTPSEESPFKNIAVGIAVAAGIIYLSKLYNKSQL